MSTSELRQERGRLGSFRKSPAADYNSAEYLSWRRLHLSKSKLSNVAEMAGFMAGFAVVATVELQINEDANPPLLVAFVITTSLLVGTCMIAVIIARCVLPHLESVAKTANISGANQSPHDKMMRLIDISWILTNSASLFFFTLDIILMAWIKYTIFSRGASIAATVIMAPVLVIIVVFALLFYRKIVKHQYVISSIKCEELDKMHKQLERASSLTSMSYQGTITSNYQTITSNHNRQWIQQQQNPPLHTRPYFFLPNSQNPSPQTPRVPQRHPYSPSQATSPIQMRHNQYRNQSHPNPNNGNQVFFSMNPNPQLDSRTRMTPHEAPGQGQGQDSPTVPLSPSWSDNSVFTV